MPAGGHAEGEPLPPQYDPQHFGAGQGYGEREEYDEGMGEEDEPRRGRRGLLIAVALIGAIGLGGAMAYTYKTFLSGSRGRAPLIKVADGGPSKIKPDNPGGREFAHTDKKLLNRLGDSGPAAAEPEAQEERASDDPNTPRRVRVIPIAPGGGPPAGAAASAPPRPPGAPVMVSVPGVMLENLGPPPAARALPPPAAAKAPPQPPPVRVASAAPAAEAPAAEVAPVRRAAAVPAKPVAPKAPVPKLKEAPASVSTSTSGTSGYVAVLASKKSRMDALKAFADLQQKYADVLAAKTPDVQEANLGEKGVWYRAVVGPPGSREAASGVCSLLKTAGHAGCWVAAY
jgi:hypothetical protein